MDPLILVVVVLALLVIIVLVKTAVVVPQQNAFVVERLGTYSGTLGAGFHVLTPFVDVIRYLAQGHKPVDNGLVIADLDGPRFQAFTQDAPAEPMATVHQARTEAVPAGR